MEEKLTVKAAGKTFEVEVSVGGMFYDKDTKLVSAKTLKGLEKKLQEKYGPKGGIPVEEWITGKRGVATGRVKSRGWRRSYVNVKWEDGKVTEEWPNSLCVPITPEIRAEKKRLEDAQEVAKDAWEAAGTAVEKHQAKYKIDKTIDAAFPTD